MRGAPRERRRPANRVIFALQKPLASIDDEGVVALKEPGNRARYYENLVDALADIRVAVAQADR